ncbi:hypothetical protein Hypma_005126 [Hypsizygus marmoreus]|uniref:DUF6699 domain-containing protein n=1 Tax=Hypsizygus marmoreus TaxID=39966 RepID=A0A369K524_HYPMA|nr:hypothetical protein Hypma_005126 [Hypsizygus marmoreus]
MAAKGVRFVRENNTYSYSPPQSPSPRQAYSPAQLEDPYLPQTPPRPPPPQAYAHASHTAHFIEENAIQFYSPTPIPSLSPAHLLPDACAPSDTPSPPYRPSPPLPPSPPHRVSAPRPPSPRDTPSTTFSSSTFSPQTDPYPPFSDNESPALNPSQFAPYLYEDGIHRFLKFSHPKIIILGVDESPRLLDNDTLSTAMTDVAFESRISTMKIKCQSLSWVIEVSGPDGSPLTVFDVLDGIYNNLRKYVTTTEFHDHEKSRRQEITQAFYRRLGRLPPPQAEMEKKKGVRRVDWLPHNSQFLGLLPSEEPTTYEMLVGNQ